MVYCNKIKLEGLIIIKVNLNTPRFDIDNNSAFQKLMESRLKNYPVSPNNLIVEIRNPKNITDIEKTKITEICSQYNFAIYSVTPQFAKEKSTAIKMGEAFKLSVLDSHLFSGEDNISSIKVMKTGSSQDFIPYTDRAINWHSDGYYNNHESKVKSMILHCANPAAEGGINSLIDHEIVFILLYKENPDYISALFDENAMTIPAHYKEDIVLREKQSGAVFSFDNDKLHMRYTARKRNIIWKDDSLILEAKNRLLEICDTDKDYVIEHRLESGQGLICNNILHKRTAFKDNGENERLMFRARYYNRIENT